MLKLGNPWRVKPPIALGPFGRKAKPIGSPFGSTSSLVLAACAALASRPLEPLPSADAGLLSSMPSLCDEFGKTDKKMKATQASAHFQMRPMRFNLGHVLIALVLLGALLWVGLLALARAIFRF